MAGRRKRSAPSATRVQAIHGAIRSNASGNIPGGPPRKTTFFPRPTPSTSACRLSGSRKPALVTACGAGGRARAQAHVESRKQSCKNKLTIARVPYALDSRRLRRRGQRQVARRQRTHRAQRRGRGPASSSHSAIPLPRAKAIRTGRSHLAPAAKCSTIPRCCARMSRRGTKKPSQQSLQRRLHRRPIRSEVLPRRLLEDEDKELIYKLTSREFLTAFERRGAQWLSADCHRSQYGYPFRVGLELTLENRHRSVTLMSLDLLRRRGDRGPVPRHEGARGQARPRARPVRSTQRPDLPRRRRGADAERQLYASVLQDRQHRNRVAHHERNAGVRPSSASAQSILC